MTRGILQCLCRPFVRGRVAASVNTNVPTDAKFKLEWEQGPVKGTFEAAPIEAKKIKGAEILYDDGSRKFYDTAFAASKEEILDATDVRASDLKKVIEKRSRKPYPKFERF